MADFIIIIRPEPDASRDVAWLKRYQVSAIAVPVMQAAKRPFDVSDIGALQAVIFTSRHAVAAVADSSAIGALRALPAYAVGRSTAAAAHQAGFAKVITGHGGGSGLVPLLVADLSPHAGALLWPSATTISFDMAASLAGFGFAVQRLPVYVMPAQTDIGKQLPDRLLTHSSAAVVAMSARSINLFSTMLRDNQLDHRRHIITVIAASQSIATAAGAGWANILLAKAARRSRLLATAAFMHWRQGLLPSAR
jgi:uroporphyrinogen-III synthase